MPVVGRAEVSHHNLGQVIFLTNYAQLAEQVSKTLPNKVDSIELRDVDYKTAVDVRARVAARRLVAREHVRCRCLASTVCCALLTASTWCVGGTRVCECLGHSMSRAGFPPTT